MVSWIVVLGKASTSKRGGIAVMVIEPGGGAVTGGVFRMEAGVSWAKAVETNIREMNRGRSFFIRF